MGVATTVGRSPKVPKLRNVQRRDSQAGAYLDHLIPSFLPVDRRHTMRTCCRAQKSWVPPKPLGSTHRRWRSHNSATLTEETLLDKIEEGLGDAPDKPRVDPATKRVRTAAGELPISPLFDPQWIASRRRKTKEYNPKPSGRFRSKVYNNIFGTSALTCALIREWKTDRL